MNQTLVPGISPMAIQAPNKDVLIVTYTNKMLIEDDMVVRHNRKNVRAWMKRHIVKGK